MLIMGTFPPGRHRWSMDFYYPNKTNDFWYMAGLIFLGSRDALLRSDGSFDLPVIKALLSEKGIALHDTGRTVRRLKGNASDKFLEIVEPVPLAGLLAQMPELKAIATTGRKAAEVIAEITGTPVPEMGGAVEWNGLQIWRMPSTSRAYPMRLEDKARHYTSLFRSAGIID